MWMWRKISTRCCMRNLLSALSINLTIINVLSSKYLRTLLLSRTIQIWGMCQSVYMLKLTCTFLTLYLQETIKSDKIIKLKYWNNYLNKESNLKRILTRNHQIQNLSKSPILFYLFFLKLITVKNPTVFSTTSQKFLKAT